MNRDSRLYIHKRDERPTTSRSSQQFVHAPGPGSCCPRNLRAEKAHV